jgi:hypothetical protein
MEMCKCAVRHHVLYGLTLKISLMTDTADECDGKEIFDAETVSTGIYGNNTQTLRVCRVCNVMKLRRQICHSLRIYDILPQITEQMQK